MGALKRVALFGVIALVVCVGLLGYFFQSLNAPGSNVPAESVLYYVKPGTSVYSLTEDLQTKKLIRNALTLRLYARFKQSHQQIKTGYFRLSTDLSAIQILDKLIAGDTVNLAYTIPEGYRIDQAAANLNKYFLSPEKYMQLARNPSQDLIRKYPFLAQQAGLETLEGFLFPDTYYLTISEQDLIEAQLKRFQEVVLPLWEKKPSTHTLSLKDTVILASIVELEGVLERELPVIAGVFLERLKLRMKLGSDPTVEYALGWHQGAKGLSLKDIQIDSPYNTYKYVGLPPGPIGNPGMAAIKAVIYPHKTPYLYFVAKGNGEHIFSKTYQEHLAAIKRIQSGNI